MRRQISLQTIHKLRAIKPQRIFTRMKPMSAKFKFWLKRIGIIGFLFFLLKGIMWLAVIWFGIDLLGGC